MALAMTRAVDRNLIGGSDRALEWLQAKRLTDFHEVVPRDAPITRPGGLWRDSMLELAPRLLDLGAPTPSEVLWMNAAPFLSLRRAPVRAAARHIRKQTACARALLDEVDRSLPQGSEPELSAQLVEELARLGCLLLDAASRLSADLDNPAPASGERLR
jgi:hypothetical protein